MKPLEIVREDYGKRGLPAIHSRLPDGPNIEYDDGQVYFQTRISDVENHFPESWQEHREPDTLDWGTKMFKTFPEHFRNMESPRPYRETSDEKRHGQ